MDRAGDLRGRAGSRTRAAGAPAGAPAELNLKRKLRIVTIASLAIWVALCGMIVSGVVTVRDIDVFDRMGPAPSELIR